MDAQQTNDVSNGSSLFDEAKLAAKLDVSRATVRRSRCIKIGRLIRCPTSMSMPTCAQHSGTNLSIV